MKNVYDLLEIFVFALFIVLTSAIAIHCPLLFVE